MSGHSKWATTKRKKAKIDGARARVFNRIIREMTVAARMGGGDIEANARLRTCVLKARAANMPAKNIENAILKGTGELEGMVIQEITYEGYGPGGVAILVDVLTDNKTRTVAEIRHAFSRHGGNMGESGSVAWMFKTQGVIAVPRHQIEEDALLEVILEAGGDDLEVGDEDYYITVQPAGFNGLLETLGKNKIETTSAEITKIAENKIKVSSDNAATTMKLLEDLEDEDDVQNVSTNAEFEDADLEKL